MKYTYTKLINSDKLLSEIGSSSIGGYLWYIETNGDQVDIVTTVALNDDQKAVLDSIISAHVSSDLAQVVKNKILAAMDFGRSLTAEYGASNVISGLTVNQIKQIMSVTSKLQAALISGSLYVALDELSSIPSPIMDEEDPAVTVISTESITEFRHKIQDYLGIPRT